MLCYVVFFVSRFSDPTVQISVTRLESSLLSFSLSVAERVRSCEVGARQRRMGKGWGERREERRKRREERGERGERGREIRNSTHKLQKGEYRLCNNMP